jgi:alkylation response protein AidB-like acyl-CoA dehydrogenase
MGMDGDRSTGTERSGRAGEDVRAEVAAWLAEHWDPELTVAEWWAQLAAAGLSNPMLAPPYGRGYRQSAAAAVNAELVKAKVLGPPGGIGTMLAAPTIAAHGTPAQQARFLPAILDGTAGWCQLFSEPGAGSDLAGLQTRAERDGDEWVVTGQKVWTSTGQYADWGILIARTDPARPKHQGITYFLCPMRQPGVEVRPLREMTGRAVFNEVFLDGARIHDDCRLGGVDDGWSVANTTLAVERAGIGGGTAFSSALPGSVAGHLGRRAGDFAGRRGDLSIGGVGASTLRHLVELAEARGRLDDPVVRQRLARLHTAVQIMRWSVARAKGGRGHGGEGSLHKIAMTGTLAQARDLACELLGPHGTLWGPDTMTGGLFQELTVFSPAPSIYGGTDEVQRNIIGERVLGLPKEPGPARDTPFRDLLVGTQR